MNNARILDLPRIPDARGNLTFLEEYKHIPFQVLRAYWIYDVPGGQERDGHAYKEQHEFIIALSGSFDVVVNDGHSCQTYFLNRPYFGIYIPPCTWRHIENFSTNSLALVLSSTHYDPDDYFRSLQEYCNFISLNEEPS